MTSSSMLSKVVLAATAALYLQSIANTAQAQQVNLNPYSLKGGVSGGVMMYDDNRFVPRSGGDASNLMATPNNATSAYSLANLFSRFANLEDCGVLHDGTDQTSVINTCMSNFASRGGGVMMVGPYTYNIGASASMTIPVGVHLACQKYLAGGTTWTTTSYRFLEDPAYGAVVSGKWSGCILLNKNTTTMPTDTRSAITQHNTFAGTGLTLQGADTGVSDMYIGGFAVGIASGTATARARLRDVNIDSNSCVQWDRSHDNGWLNNVECFPFMVPAAGYKTTYSITGAADNGSGNIRLTIPGHAMVAGDKVWVDQVVGLEQANKSWTVTVIDSSHVDLQGSDSSPVNLNTTLFYGTDYAQVPSTYKLVPGEPFSCPGLIPSDTKIRYVWSKKVGLTLTNKSSSTVATVCSVGGSAYVSGGKATIDGAQRTGDGFEFSYSEGTTTSGTFVFNHPIHYHIGAGLGWLNMNNVTSDGDHLNDQDNTCFVLDGGNSINVTGGSLLSCTWALKVNSASLNPNMFTAMTWNIGDPAYTSGLMEIAAGYVTATAIGGPPHNLPLLVAAYPVQLTAVADNWVGQLFFTDNGSSLTNVTSIASTWVDGTFAGTVSQVGKVTLGGGSETCGRLTSCGVTLLGPLATQGAVDTLMVNGGTYQFSGNSRDLSFKKADGTTTTNPTFDLLSVGSGYEREIYFVTAVTGATWTSTAPSTAVRGGPASISANSYVRCHQTADGSMWNCGQGG